MSIIVNNYNYGQFVAEAIESALAQGYPGVEVIVVDDGSTDGSVHVLEQYEGRVRLVLKENGGQASAFNAGFSVSSGQYVHFLDADDLLPVDYVERAVARAEASPDAGGVQMRLVALDAVGVPTGAVVPPAYVRLAHGLVGEAVRTWTASSSFAPGGGWLFRRDALERVMPVPEAQLRVGVDFVITHAVALLAPIVADDSPGPGYRVHGRNDSHSPELDLDGLRRALHRQIFYASLLRAFALREGLEPPADVMTARDALFLSQRIASLRLDPLGHPFQERRGALALRGVVAAVCRRDLALSARLLHAGWFVIVAVAPLAVARTAAELLLQHASRARHLERLRGVLRLRVKPRLEG